MLIATSYIYFLHLNCKVASLDSTGCSVVFVMNTILVWF